MQVESQDAPGSIAVASGELAKIELGGDEGGVDDGPCRAYALNSITKQTVQVFFLTVGLFMFGHAILTPLLMVLAMITGDFLGMSLTAYNVRGSPMPNAWQIGNLTIAGVITGIGELAFCTPVLAFGAWSLLDIGTQRTLAFIVIVFANQTTTYTKSRTPAVVVLLPELLGSSCRPPSIF